MQNFMFYNPCKIIFGKGESENIGSYLKDNGAKRVLFHFGGQNIKKSGLYDTVTKSLQEAGLYITELGGVVPNPRLSLVRKGIALCKEEKIDFILAVGGGSVIDSAKAIAVGVKCEGDIWDYYIDNSRQVNNALPIATILTIPAAGSESSDSSVITNDGDNFKRYCGTAAMIPKFSILDPALTFTLPAYQTACGVSDILAHLMERYFCPTQNVDLTDRLIEACAKTIMNFGPLAQKNPDNYDIRAEVMWCGTIAHNNLLNMGREGDWSSHNIEHELSGVYDIAHGAGLSIVFPAWMKYVWRENKARFTQFARRIMGVEFAAEQEENGVLLAIERLEQFYRSMGLPVRLSEAGIGAENFRMMAENCVFNRGSIGSFKTLYAGDIQAIYELAK